MSYMNTKKLSAMMAGLEDSDGVARVVDVTNAEASATNDHPAAPTAEADSKGEAATAADTVTVGHDDGVTPTIQDAINKGVQVGEDVTKMESAKAALEHYIEKVSNYVDANESVPPSLAKAIQIGLRRHDAKFFAQTVPALESFDAPVGRMTVSLELLDKLKSGAKAVGKGITEAIKKLIELIMNAWNFVSTDRVKLAERLAAAKKTIQANDIPSDLKIDYSGLKSLTIDGDIAASDTTAIDNLLHVSNVMMVKWPKHILEICTQMRSTFKNTDMDDDSNVEAYLVATFTTLTKALNTMLGNFADRTATDSTTVCSSGLLPGNRRVVMTLDKDRLASPMQVLLNFSGAFGIKHIVDSSMPAASKEVKVADKSELLAGLAKVEGLIDFGNERETAAKELRAFNSSLGSFEAGAAPLVSFSRAALSFSVSYLGYLNSTTKAYVSYYEKVAAASSKGKKDE